MSEKGADLATHPETEVNWWPAVGRRLDGLEEARQRMQAAARAKGIAHKIKPERERPAFKALVGARQLQQAPHLSHLTGEEIRTSDFVRRALQRVQPLGLEVDGTERFCRIYTPEQKLGPKGTAYFSYIMASLPDIQRYDGTYQFALERSQLREELGLPSEGTATEPLDFELVLVKAKGERAFELDEEVLQANMGMLMTLSEVTIEMLPYGVRESPQGQ
ncbi:MAG TPA: hypothetical protein VK694_00025 [Verrucomicrobiae bacterium]|nr:hypothetical protein [Verrucomicrobiae bacterium]